MRKTKRENTFLSFRVGKETFAVSVKKVLEVLEKQYVTEVPNVPEHVKGVINFRGEIIPVIETRLKFNLPKREEGQKYVVIVFDVHIDGKKMLIGAITDNVEDVIAPDGEDIQEVPEMGYNYNTEFLLGMLKNKQRFTMILDIDKVFSKEDVNILKTATNELLEADLGANGTI